MYLAMEHGPMLRCCEPVCVPFSPALRHGSGELGGLGFASAGSLAAAAGGGPATFAIAVAIAAIPALVAGIKAIFRRGHKDDAVGEADGLLMGKVVSPILSEILQRPVGTTWPAVDPATDEVAHLEENHRWPLTAQRTSDLMGWADQAISQACAEYSRAGYPCHEYVPGKSGAATLAFTKWNRLRGYMAIGMAQAQQRESEQTVTGAVTEAGNMITAAGQSAQTWLGEETSIGGEPVPNWLLAGAAGVALYMVTRN